MKSSAVLFQPDIQQLVGLFIKEKNSYSIQICCRLLMQMSRKMTTGDKCAFLSGEVYKALITNIFSLDDCLDDQVIACIELKMLFQMFFSHDQMKDYHDPQHPMVTHMLQNRLLSMMTILLKKCRNQKIYQTFLRIMENRVFKRLLDWEMA